MKPGDHDWMNTRRILIGLLLCIAAATSSACSAAAANPSDALAGAPTGSTLRVDPPSQTVQKGVDFSIHIIVNGPIPLSGAQFTLAFDHASLQIVNAAWSDAASKAPILQPKELTSAVASANENGQLKMLMVAYTGGSLPAGSTELLMVTLQPTRCGKVTLDLPVGPNDAILIDGRAATLGQGVPVSTTSAAVQITC
jgi:hypothetical protein